MSGTGDLSELSQAKDSRRWTTENRIRANHRLLEALGVLWDANPDQRLGQLVMNLSREPDGFADTWEWNHQRWFEAINDAYHGWGSPRPKDADSGGSVGGGRGV